MSYIDVGEAELWVEDSGGDGTPIVLLHAAAGNARAWDMQRPLFEASGYRVITPTREPNTLARLGTIKVPSMVIAGGDDTYIPEPVMKLIADSIPGSEYEIIDGVGHSPFWEKPEEWNRVVTRFLAKHA